MSNMLEKKKYENTRHFIYKCQPKWEIWANIFIHYYPNIYLTEESIENIILNLKIPSIFKRKEHPKLFTIVSTTLYVIWLHHWRKLIDEKTFDIFFIIHDIINRVYNLNSRKKSDIYRK